ncbi:MAG: choice-of-anchor K domain-containing protein [Aulosira sp. ZfuCHP01]|nr:choice-of-anchor K domain-containing protein [Aulosira sp. ZfuVER01]MDZ7997186.1 choice-of-anchor K domain-containing protein [Aulosira sp. DedVER01a]MDZ8056039.1 choice-of-anchor K domain-containing protein [Aulosira sp. ZfuCHP01]
MIAATAFGFSSQAQAFTISGKAVGAWYNPIPDIKNKFCSNNNTDCKFVTGVGTKSFSWGEPAKNTPPNQPNQLTFIGNSFSANGDSWFKLGNLEYFNGTIYDDTNIEYVTLNLDLSFGDNNQVSKSLPISFYLENTTNLITDNIKDPRNADSIYINTALAKTSFQWNQDLYEFEIMGFSQSSPVTSLSAIESESRNAGLYARVTSRKAVPEPSTIAASLLAGTYLIYRKKFSKLTAKSSYK